MEHLERPEQGNLGSSMGYRKPQGFGGTRYLEVIRKHGIGGHGQPPGRCKVDLDSLLGRFTIAMRIHY